VQFKHIYIYSSKQLGQRDIGLELSR